MFIIHDKSNVSAIILRNHRIQTTFFHKPLLFGQEIAERSSECDLLHISSWFRAVCSLHWPPGI